METSCRRVSRNAARQNSATLCETLRHFATLCDLMETRFKSIDRRAAWYRTIVFELEGNILQSQGIFLKMLQFLKESVQEF